MFKLYYIFVDFLKKLINADLFKNGHKMISISFLFPQAAKNVSCEVKWSEHISWILLVFNIKKLYFILSIFAHIITCEEGDFFFVDAAAEIY